MRISPAPTHQVPVPAQQCLGPDEEPGALGLGQQAAESGEQGPVSRTKRRSGDLPAKNRNLVTQHDDLDCQIGGAASPQSQEFEHPGEGDIEEGQGHRPPSLPRRRYRNSLAQGGG